MQITEVKDKQDARDFLKVPHIIYQDDPNWIPHLERDVEAVFDPSTNPVFQDGELNRWLLRDGDGRLIGRIAAFYIHKLAHTHKQPTGSIGFFECVHNREAAFLLFDKSREWLQDKGMEAMDGPVNFGEKDRFWGLLVDGFDRPPPYLLNYNLPYYRELFESYGFQNYYNQYVYRAVGGKPLPAVLERKFQRLTENGGYHFESIKINQLDRFAEDFVSIYNKAWGQAHTYFRPMTKTEALNTFHKMKDVIDEDLILFCYHNGHPVAFFIGLPELNQIFRYLNGKLNLIGKLKFLYHQWRGTCRTVYGMVFGVMPEYQNRGLESALAMAVKRNIEQKNRYHDMYITWLGDFNPKMIKIIEHFGADRVFTLVTYRKLFDEQAIFERHPVIG